MRHPGLTAAGCLTLALGIGANAAVFSIVDAALFRPLPYRDADRLVTVYRTVQTRDGRQVEVAIDGAGADTVRHLPQIFEGVEVFSDPRPRALAAGVDQSPWIGGFAPGLPAFLGVRPQVGRTFTTDDVAAQDAIVLSDGYWRRAFNRDVGVIGRSLTFTDRSYVIIGVMPATFRYFVGAQADAWLAIGDRNGGDLAARLRPGLPIEQARRDIDAAVTRLTGRTSQGWEIVQAGWNRTDPAARMMLLSLLGAVGLLLLIACANVANLLLARTLTRQHEIVVRGALGATRGRLIAQFLIEGLALAGLGSLAAGLFAWWSIHLIPAMMPAEFARTVLAVSLPRLDLRVVAFGGVAAVIAGLACAAVPAMRATAATAGGGPLSGGQRIAGLSRRQRRLRASFQAAQVALTLVLLVCAGLLLNSFIRMVGTPAGFDADHLGYVTLGFPPQSFASQTQKVGVVEDLIARMAAAPGMRGVAIGPAPVSAGRAADRLTPDGDPSRAALVVHHDYSVGPGYFQVARIAIEEGRPFGAEDRPDTPRTVIIRQNAATLLWPGRSSLGRRLTRFKNEPPSTVVGVVPHLRTTDLASDGVELFYPASQFGVSPAIVFRTGGDIATAADAIRADVRATDSRIAVVRIGTVDSLFAEFDPWGSRRFFASLIGLLAVLGLVTATVGLYGLVSYDVSQRTREIGVRMALGAGRARVGALVVGEALRPVATGIALGLIAALWVSRFIASQLFHVTSRDPATFVTVAAALVVACGLAVIVPVRRATTLDASVALRME